MDLHRRVRVGTRVLVLPGRAPARDVLGSAPTMLPGNTSVEAKSPSSAMVR